MLQLIPPEVRAEFKAVREAAEQLDSALSRDVEAWTTDKRRALSELCRALVVALRRL